MPGFIFLAGTGNFLAARFLDRGRRLRGSHWSARGCCYAGGPMAREGRSGSALSRDGRGSPGDSAGAGLSPGHFFLSFFLSFFFF